MKVSNKMSSIKMNVHYKSTLRLLFKVTLSRHTRIAIRLFYFNNKILGFNALAIQYYVMVLTFYSNDTRIHR